MAAKRKQSEKLTSSKVKKKYFRYSDDMIFDLINCLMEYKLNCAFSNIDFDADRKVQYKVVREEMAKLYSKDVDMYDMFGPVELDFSLPPDLLKKQKDAVESGKQRVLEKIKDIRQGFSKAVINDNGTRSGSGKIVLEHYDALIKIWGGSANTEPLPSGVDTSSINLPENENQSTPNDTGIDMSVGEAGPAVTSEVDQDDEESHENEDDDQVIENSQVPVKPNYVHKLIDNKRKQLERNLSAAQRDALLLKEAREDRKERKEFIEVMKNSNETLATALTTLSQSMLNISNSFALSTQLMARSFENNNENSYPNMMYQNNYNPAYSQPPRQPQHNTHCRINR